jgi:hypothetical protein
VELFERHADNAATQADIAARQQAMFAAYQAVDYSSLSAQARMRDWLALALWQLTITRTTQEAVRAVYQWDAQNIRNLKEWRHFPILIRDIFQNLFRPVAVDPSWLAWNDGTVVKLAQAIYDDRAFDRLPILADALEEAGCDNADILAHCRQTGEHVRGCWVVDLILGKR